MLWNRARHLASIGLVSGIALTVACGGKKAPAPPPPPPPPPPVQVATPPPPAPVRARPAPQPTAPPAAPTEQELFNRMSLADLNAKQPLVDAYFAYDKADLTQEALATLTRDADWLRKWGTVRVLIEGHADERGTSEYNLALGERRADSVRKYLAGIGVSVSRVDIVSKGKEAPFCTTHDEDCWYQNRRGHFVITAK